MSLAPLLQFRATVPEHEDASSLVGGAVFIDHR